MTPDRSTADRSTPSRRAAARRFSLLHDPWWERLQRAVLAAGAAAALAAVLTQIGLVVSGTGVLAGIAAVAGATAAWPVRVRSAGVLRWDGVQWWWHPAGKPFAVTPEVFIDIEQWMLLRLRSAEEPGAPSNSPWSTDWIAVSRRSLGSQWSSLRLHLFLTRS